MTINSSSNNLSEVLNFDVSQIVTTKNSQKIREGDMKNHNASIESHHGLINCFSGEILYCILI